MEKSLALSLLNKFNADREKIERYAALTELCPLPAFIIGHDRFSILYINPAYQVLTGRNIEELQNDQWINLVIHPDDRAGVRERWEKFTNSSQPEIPPDHHRYINREGAVTDAATILRRVEGNGYVGFILPKCEASFECPIYRLNKLASPAGF